MTRPIELGPFLLLDPIGSGAMGTVYHAIHPDSGTRAAVKVVRPEAASHQRVLDNLEAEVRAVALLDHPHIVRIYDVGRVTRDEAERVGHRVVPETPWFAMEIAEHGSLKRRLRSLDPGDFFDLLRSLLGALAHAHARGILHLDLKPSNVMFSGRITGPVLTDFGMGVVGDPDPTGDFIRGTPHFMAPEQVRGRWEELGPWTDLYALGNLAWLAATGKTAVPDGAPDQILAAQLSVSPPVFEPSLELPPGFEGWVRRLLHKDPDRRYLFAADALAALDEVFDRGTREVDERGRPRVPEDWRVSEHEGAAEVSESTGLGLAVLRPPPVIGRTRERSVLWQALREASHGRTWAVVVRGPAGSGKSRLGQWLGIRAHELGAASTLATRHGPDVEGGVRAALRRYFPVDLRDWDGEAGLGTRLMERGLAGTVAHDVAAWLVRGVIEHPTAAHDSWWDLAAEALLAVGVERLPILFVDDAHHGAATLRFARWLLTTGRRVPAVLVLAAEDEALLSLPEADELLQEIETLDGVVTLELGPLSEQARVALARRMLPLEPSLVAELAEKTEGSPGYTVELLHDLAGRGVLERGPRGLRLREGEHLTSPRQLASLWQDHLDAVLADRPAWQRPFEVAAVLGTTVDTEQWREACRKLGLDAPDELFAALVDARLARPHTNGLRFLLPMMCDAVAERVSDPEVHRVCAEVLSDHDEARAGDAWYRANEPERALDLWLRRAVRFRQGQPGRLEGALARVHELAAEVLPAGDRRWITVHDLEASLDCDRGRVPEAAAAASRLWEVADDDDSQLCAHLAMARTAAEGLETRAALRHLRAASEQLERGIVGDPVPPMLQLVEVALDLGEVDTAEAWLSHCPRSSLAAHAWARLDLVAGRWGEAATTGRRIGSEVRVDRLVRAQAALLEGTARLGLGEFEEAVSAFQAARRRFRALGHVRELLAGLSLAIALDALHHHDEALRVLDAHDGPGLGPRLAWKAALASVAIRISHPADISFGAWWKKVRRDHERDARLDPEDRVVLQHARRRAARDDRAEEIASLLGVV